MLYSEHWWLQLLLVLRHWDQRHQSLIFLGKKWEWRCLLFSLILLAFAWCFCATCLPHKSGKFAPKCPCLVFVFSSHCSHVFGRMPYLFTVPCACLVLQLSITWVPLMHNYMHLCMFHGHIAHILLQNLLPCAWPCIFLVGYTVNTLSLIKASRRTEAI